VPGWLVAAALLAVTLIPRTVTAEITFTALVEGVWTVHWQADPQAKPLAVRSDLAVDAAAPALSPDARQISFEVSGRGIVICPLEPSGSCTSLDSEFGWAARPAWDPRSEELVFARYQADARGEDSEILKTRNSLEGFGPLVTQTGNQDDPDISADGRWLAYTSTQTISLRRAGVQVVRQIWLMDLGTGRARPLVPGAFQDMHPDWSPDGRRIAFASDRSGQFQIWVVGADGSALTQITSGSGSNTWPAWSADGTSIMYARAHDGQQTLWITDLETSTTTRHEPFVPGSSVQLRDPDWR
jgi:Tol biopolymer transport system component